MTPGTPIGRRAVLKALAAGCGAVALSGCAGGSGPRSTDSVRIILGHGAAPGNPRALGAIQFQELVREKSNGEVEIQILGQESVGSDTEMMVSTASGSLDMTINSQGPFSSYVPEAALIGLPFLFESSEHAHAVVDGEVQDYLRGRAEEKGFHVLGFWDNGMRDITNSKRPIRSPEDLRGMKIRVPDDQMTISIFSELGANPTPLAFGELYLALRQGAVDGQENPVVNIKSASLQEVQSHLAVIGHQYQVNPFVMSTQRWERMDSDIRTVIEDAAEEAKRTQRELMAEQTAAIYQEFESVLEYTRPDRDQFREATRPVFDAWQEKHPEFFAALTSAAESTRAEHGKQA
jgi:tripartite ATP-independent transporter DctP family solute receptor